MSAIYVSRTCDRCGGKFRQPFGRGRPKKYCDQDCADEAKRERGRDWASRNASRTCRRFGSREAFWAWQRSPERRAELSRAVKAVVEQCRKVGKAWGRGTL